MPAEQPPNPPTTEDCIGFLQSKKAITACSACGTNNWDLLKQPSPDHRWGVPGNALSGGILGPIPSVPTFLLVCVNCAHIRQHSLKAVEQWIAQGRPGA